MQSSLKQSSLFIFGKYDLDLPLTSNVKKQMGVQALGRVLVQLSVIRCHLVFNSKNATYSYLLFFFQAAKEENKRNREILQHESDRQCVLNQSRSVNCTNEPCCHGNCDHLNNEHADLDIVTLKDKMYQYAMERKSRENLFIEKLQAKRNSFIENLLVPAK